MSLAPSASARFSADLDALSAHSEKLGVAVSGGPDSLALLLLAIGARPGRVEAATVDHGLRPESILEAERVADICNALGIPHATLRIRWPGPPRSSIQARARDERYALLSEWAESRGVGALATAHHADDQAETLLMRLARGSGIAGLSGARRSRDLTTGVKLIRPLLRWRKTELAALVASAGLQPSEDPSNRDERFDRARVRVWLASAEWLDPARLATSAANLRDADDALEFSMVSLTQNRLTESPNSVEIDPSSLPREYQRRLLLAGLERLGAPIPRGADLLSAIDRLTEGETTTLSDIKLQGGERWRLTPAPPRRRT